MNTEPRVLRGATLPGAPGRVDVRLEYGRIAAVQEAGTIEVEGALDLSGYLLLPAGVEPHAHLDKALLGDLATNPVGDLAGAIAANRSVYPTLTRDGIRRRALTVLDTAIRHGYTLVRSHANIEPGLGLAAVDALRDVAAEVATDIDLQVVGMVGFPLTGPEGRETRELLTKAVGAGIDVIGGAPWLDEHVHDAIGLLVDCAADAGLPVDLHLDETLDPAISNVRTFAAEVERRGLGGRAVASHCVSLGQQSTDQISETAAALVDAGVAVVALPQTNLLLQGRELTTAVPRAVPPVRALQDAGVQVAGGGDNWRDMFNPLGRIDPFETAALLVAAAQVSPETAYACVSTDARAVLTGDAGGVRIGASADLLAVRAASLHDAVAGASEDRIVLRRGRVLTRTRVDIARGYSWYPN